MAEDPKRTSKYTRLAIKNACEILARKRVPFVLIYETDPKKSDLVTNAIGTDRLKNFKNILGEHIVSVETKAKLQEGNEED